MKKISIFCLIIFLLINCRKNDESDFVNDLNLTTIPGWPTIDFKTNYTIQVPEAFSGGVQPGFEGNSFYAYSTDKKIQLNSGYGWALGVNDFGEKLGNPQPKSIQVITNLSTTVILDQIEYFKQITDTAGIFYYSKSGASRGRLYWRDNGVLKDALEIDFNLTELETVNKIIQSIKRK